MDWPSGSSGSPRSSRSSTHVSLTHRRSKSTMNAAIRWRIIVLQVVALFVLAIGHRWRLRRLFVHQRRRFTISSPRNRSPSPKTPPQACPTTSKHYAGQQVLTGEQAHAYAEKFIGLHLSEIGQGHPVQLLEWQGDRRSRGRRSGDRSDDQGATDAPRPPRSRAPPTRCSRARRSRGCSTRPTPSRSLARSPSTPPSAWRWRRSVVLGALPLRDRRCPARSQQRRATRSGDAQP